MKHIYFYRLLILYAALICTACVQKNNTETAPKPEGTISVAVTIFPLYDFTRAAAGDTAKITMLVPPGADIHSYTPSPHDIDIIQNSDIFLYIGGTSDGWAEGVKT